MALVSLFAFGLVVFVIVCGALALSMNEAQVVVKQQDKLISPGAKSADFTPRMRTTETIHPAALRTQNS